MDYFLNIILMIFIKHFNIKYLSNNFIQTLKILLHIFLSFSIGYPIFFFITLPPSFYQTHPFHLFSTIFLDMGMKGLSLIFLAIEVLIT